MNRCQRRLLLAYGIQAVVLVAFCVGFGLLGPPGWAVIAFLIFIGALSAVLGATFQRQWDRCRE